MKALFALLGYKPLNINFAFHVFYSLAGNYNPVIPQFTGQLTAARRQLFCSEFLLSGFGSPIRRELGVGGTGYRIFGDAVLGGKEPGNKIVAIGFGGYDDTAQIELFQ